MTSSFYKQASKSQIKRFAKLQLKKFRDKEKLFLAEGLRTVTELLNHLPDEKCLTALFIEPAQLCSIPNKDRFHEKIFLIDHEEGYRLSGTSTAQGVVGIFSQQQSPVTAKASFGRVEQSLAVALDDVQDPGNVGTIVRTAAWFGISDLICGPGTADRYNPKAIRAGAGSIFCMRHYGVDDLREELERMRRGGYEICCSSLQGTDFRDFDAWPEKMVLVIGNEANGIGQEILTIADRHVTIPHGRDELQVESLNAAVSASILMAMLTL